MLEARGPVTARAERRSDHVVGAVPDAPGGDDQIAVGHLLEHAQQLARIVAGAPDPGTGPLLGKCRGGRPSPGPEPQDRKSTRLNCRHVATSYTSVYMN